MTTIGDSDTINFFIHAHEGVRDRTKGNMTAQVDRDRSREWFHVISDIYVEVKWNSGPRYFPTKHTLDREDDIMQSSYVKAANRVKARARACVCVNR